MCTWSRAIIIFITVRVASLAMVCVVNYMSRGIFSIPIGVLFILVLRYMELTSPNTSSYLSLSGDIIMADFFQLWISLMCFLVIILAAQSSYHDIGGFNHSLLKLLLVVNFYLIRIFISTQNMFNLFILFELSIIPIFIIILGWGYQPEKIKAAYSLFFFTAVTASPIVGVLTHLLSGGSRIFLPELARCYHLSFYGEAINFILLCGFLVKLPIYGLHLWLPLAHVEAPVYGSMVLAGILLKLGGLGVLRLNATISSHTILNMFIMLSLLRLILVGATCLFTVDLKKVIAFSSVSHMAFTIVFLISINRVSSLSSIIIMISHAFRSSGMFLVIYIFYLSTNSRNILVNMGMLVKYPHVVFIWLIIIISSLGGPPAINLLAEIWCLMYRFTHFYKVTILIIVGFILSSCYHVILYRTLSQRSTSWYLSRFNRSTRGSSFLLLATFHVTYTIYLWFLVRSFI